jgi:hypothetical protein
MKEPGQSEVPSQPSNPEPQTLKPKTLNAETKFQTPNPEPKILKPKTINPEA